jgi:anti-anti-sigma factor
MKLEIKSEVIEADPVLHLVGAIDSATSPNFLAAMEAALASKPPVLTLDFEHTTFLSSAGLRVIIIARQKMPSLRLNLYKPSEAIVNTLKISGFYDSVYVLDGPPE